MSNVCNREARAGRDGRVRVGRAGWKRRYRPEGPRGRAMDAASSSTRKMAAACRLGRPMEIWGGKRRDLARIKEMGRAGRDCLAVLGVIWGRVEWRIFKSWRLADECILPPLFFSLRCPALRPRHSRQLLAQSRVSAPALRFSVHPPSTPSPPCLTPRLRRRLAPPRRPRRPPPHSPKRRRESTRILARRMRSPPVRVPTRSAPSVPSHPDRGSKRRQGRHVSGE